MPDLVEWRFTDLAADRFHWISRQAPRASDPAAPPAWTITAEFFFQRVVAR